MNKRFGDMGVSILQDESDGALSAPEMPPIRRDRGIFDIDFLSTSALVEIII